MTGTCNRNRVCPRMQQLMCFKINFSGTWHTVHIRNHLVHLKVIINSSPLSLVKNWLQCYLMIQLKIFRQHFTWCFPLSLSIWAIYLEAATPSSNLTKTRKFLVSKKCAPCIKYMYGAPPPPFFKGAAILTTYLIIKKQKSWSDLNEMSVTWFVLGCWEEQVFLSW